MSSKILRSLYNIISFFIPKSYPYTDILSKNIHQSQYKFIKIMIYVYYASENVGFYGQYSKHDPINMQCK